LDSHVPSSLAYMEQGFLLAVGSTSQELEFIPIAHLTDQALFSRCHVI